MKRRLTGEPEWIDTGRRLRRRTVNLLVHFLALLGMTLIYYIGFSLLFDTPVEYRMKRSTHKLEKQYKALTARYDSLELVLANVVERDRNVFGILFESEPYDLEASLAASRLANYEKLTSKSNRELGDEFFARIGNLEQQTAGFLKSYGEMELKAEELGNGLLSIPATQPVVNNDLTLLTASYGMRIHPFYKTLASHQGVDFSVPEGSRVFATADGTVRDILRHSTSGNTLVISHQNGYETMYAHLDKINVRKGDRVRRGDIVALSGNSGLSLAPHLHYEVIHNGMRVDPVPYFFMEVTPDKYEKIVRIAQSGMQSFD